MTYAILRAKKLKTPAAIAKSLRHTYREIPVPNADAKLTAGNRIVGADTSAEALAKVRARWPEKRRKDAVLAIEYLITASPEAFKRHGGQLDEGRYFSQALAWLKKRHGAENVVVAGIHRDETTPHMVAYVVPELDGKLNAKHFLAGPKALSAMQDDFHQVCGKPHALERGIKGSKAKHQSIRQFYTLAMRKGEVPQLSKADLAAAAVGIQTEGYKQAQEVARNASRAAMLARTREKAVKARASALERRETEVEKKAEVALRALDGQSNTYQLHQVELAKERAKIEAAQREAEAEREKSARLRRELAEAEAARELWLRRSRELEAQLPKQERGHDGPRMG